MSERVGSLEARIDSAIAGNPHLVGRSLECETRAGRVVLRGVVGSYYQKQMAQEAVRTVDGVEEVHNHLEVCW